MSKESRGLEIPMHPKKMRMWRPSNTAPTPQRISSVAPSSSSMAPTSPSVAPTSPSVAPTSPSVASPSVAPPSPSLAPPSPSVAPTSPSVAPTSPSMAPTSASVAPTSPSVGPTSPSVAPTSPSVAPPSPSVAPLSPAVAPPYPCSAPSPAKFMECGNNVPLPASPGLHIPPPRLPRHLRDEDITFLVNHGSDDDSDSDDEETYGVMPAVPRAFRIIMETPLDQDEAAADPPPAAEIVPAVLQPIDVPPAIIEQPRHVNDFVWRDFPNTTIPPESRREIFSEINVGPTIPCTDPYDIFIEIWDQQIMEHIAIETNRYAQQVVSQMLENHNLHPSSRITRWHDTTADELYVYFALILAMGVVVKSRVEEYWAATPYVFCTPGFSAHMAMDRFLILSKCLHFNNNDDMCELDLDYAEARLFKIQPILSHLNMKFQKMYVPSQNIAVDESLLMWKGWVEFCPHNPNETANRVLKTYELCESQTGYLWRFEMHAQKKKSPQLVVDPLELSTLAIVLQLVKGLEHKGYTLWMDNYYQSPCLARRLKSLGFDCVGTLRTDRRFVPQAINSLTKQNMCPGQITGLTSGDVDVMVWRYSNRVAMISTYHGNGQQTVRGSTNPILILDYSIMMGGMDKKDQLLAMYPVDRKPTMVWYKKIFRRLLNISVLNSYIIHHHSSNISHRNFRRQLITSILSKHCTPPPIPPAITQNVRAHITHRIAELPMGNHQRMRRTCTVCKKAVRTFCVGCDKTTCIGACFLTIHS